MNGKILVVVISDHRWENGKEKRIEEEIFRKLGRRNTTIIFRNRDEAEKEGRVMHEGRKIHSIETFNFRLDEELIWFKAYHCR